jgi:hypothetical protein
MYKDSSVTSLVLASQFCSNYIYLLLQKFLLRTSTVEILHHIVHLIYYTVSQILLGDFEILLFLLPVISTTKTFTCQNVLPKLWHRENMPFFYHKIGNVTYTNLKLRQAINSLIAVIRKPYWKLYVGKDVLILVTTNRWLNFCFRLLQKIRSLCFGAKIFTWNFRYCFWYLWVTVFQTVTTK